MSMMSCRSLDTYELLAGEAESRIVYVEAWIPTSNVGTTTPAQQTPFDLSDRSTETRAISFDGGLRDKIHPTSFLQDNPKR